MQLCRETFSSACARVVPSFHSGASHHILTRALSRKLKAPAHRHHLLSCSRSFESAPAIGALGLPQVAVVGGRLGGGLGGGASSSSATRRPPEIRPEVVEAAEALRSEIREILEASEGSSVRPDVSGTRHTVQRLLSLANSASLAEFSYIAKNFEECQLRLPMRDMLPALVGYLRGLTDDEAVPDAINLLTSCGRCSLFLTELFDFLKTKVPVMKASELSTFIYECGRHGLRCRHHSDRAVKRAVQLVPQMSLEELMRTWQGFIRFNRDRREFFMAARARVQAHAAKLSTHNLLLALRAARDLRFSAGFLDLHGACCTEVLARLDTLTPSQVAGALAQCIHYPKYRPSAQRLVAAIERNWSEAEDLSSLRAIEAVDALEVFASWKLHLASSTTLRRLDALLVERRVELQYAGNVGMWNTALAAFARLEDMEAKWPFVCMELARDRHFLDRNSLFEQCAAVSSFTRLRMLDDVVLDNVAHTVLSDMELLKRDLVDMAELLWSFASVGNHHPELFDQCYDRLLNFMEREEIDLGSRMTQQAMLQLTWSFTCAGFHKKHESFAALLDYCLFMDLDIHARAQSVRWLMELADASVVEVPEAGGRCQYPDKLLAARSLPRVRQLVKSTPLGDEEVLKEVVAMLKELGWQHSLGHMADDTVPAYIDISLEEKFGRKVGLLVPGSRGFLRCGLPQEKLPSKESGALSLTRRLLHARGWVTGVVDSEKWRNLPPKKRLAYLGDLVTEC